MIGQKSFKNAYLTVFFKNLVIYLLYSALNLDFGELWTPIQEVPYLRSNFETRIHKYFLNSKGHSNYSLIFALESSMSGILIRVKVLSNYIFCSYRDLIVPKLFLALQKYFPLSVTWSGLLTISWPPLMVILQKEIMGVVKMLACCHVLGLWIA